MKPIAILETYKLSPIGEFGASYTLVIDPILGMYRELTRDEAQRIIEERDLFRYEQKEDNATSGTIVLGAVWDTIGQEYKKYWSAQAAITRWLRRYRLPRSMNRESNRYLHIRKVAARVAYKEFLFRRIDKLFSE